MADSFVQARWFRRGRLRPIRLVVVHCTVSKEMGTGAEAVARYFANVTRRASTHLVADSDTVVRCVADGDTCYGAGGVNADGLHIELVGMPDQTLAQWLDDYGRAMFATAAPDLRQWMDAYAIPARWLTVDQLRDGTSKGFCTHADAEAAFPSTGHWDPGPHFPKGEFLAAVTGSIEPDPREDDPMFADICAMVQVAYGYPADRATWTKDQRTAAFWWFDVAAQHGVENAGKLMANDARKSGRIA